MDEIHDNPIETESDELVIVMCCRCGHPNLEFRNHCRRCGAPLRGSSNLIPGVELFEWTATDGPHRQYRPAASGWPLLMLIAACFAILSFLLAGMPNAAFLAVPCVLVVGIIYWVHRRKNNLEDSDEMENAEEPVSPDTGDCCAACGAAIESIDDICAACGAVVASDIQDA